MAIKKTFLTGFFVLIPLLVTAYIIYIVISSVDAFLSPLIRNITFRTLGKEIFIPGTGFVLFVVIAYITGIVASNFAGKKLISYGEAILQKIPFVKGIYASVKDMTDAFSSDKAKSFKEVVLVEFPFKGRYTVGFVTKRVVYKGESFCSVFVPTTPNPTSGYLIMVPEKELDFIDVPPDDAIKYIVSLGTARIELEWKEKKSSTF